MVELEGTAQAMKKKNLFLAKYKYFAWWGTTCNYVRNILKLFDSWANFPFTTSKIKCDY